MDTIIYVYKEKSLEKHNKEEYCRKEYDMGDYQLVQIGVCEEMLRILQEREIEVTEQEAEKESQNQGGNLRRKLSVAGIRIPWRKLRDKRRKHRAEVERQLRLVKEAESRQDFLKELLKDEDHNFLVTQQPIPFLDGWSFRDYLEDQWVFHMMQYGEGNHFIILGKAACIPRLVLHYVKRMKSLKWWITKRQFGEAEEELVEEIYDEFGLAVEVHLLEEEKDFRKSGLSCKIPTVIIDFCREEKVFAADVAKESIWLDMTASEEKRSRLEGRNAGILYFSLKKEWKQPEKALYYLDTINKNGYNT